MENVFSDQEENRCRQLGHLVPFGYCRMLQGEFPCRFIADCWWQRFDVAVWLRTRWPEEVIARFTAPPPAKLAGLAAIIARVRKGNPNV